MNTSEVASKRFDGLWRRRAASANSVAPGDIHAELCRRLGGSKRRFHNLDHIRDCLHRFDEIASMLLDPDAVEVALWFHDAVYEPNDTNNERRSAELFLSFSGGADPVFRRRVCRLIMSTRHQGTPYGNDRCFIEDIDLAGFGAPWEEFMRQGVLLREEFAAQSDEQYLAGQVFFLERLKRRPSFFATDFFRGRYEAKAQDNLDRLLTLLADQGYRSAPA